MKKIFYWRFSRKIEGEFWIFYKRFPWEKNWMEEIFKGISLKNWSWIHTHASLARAVFPLKLSLIVSEEAISSRRRPPPIGYFFCNIFFDFVFATLIIRQNVCNIGFCNIYFFGKKFATMCFATCQKNAKFHATFFCNKNVAKIRFCNICVDFGNVLKNKVISSGVKNCY